ncbi:MAG: hypothetical protein GY842_14845 [bacterium]|nr:hypothetical protein [bacterium]
MADEPQTGPTTCSGLHDWMRIFGAVRMALHPTKLVLALTALLLTFCWTGVLDSVWTRSEQGVHISSIAQFTDPELAAAAARSPGVATHGVGELWRDHMLMSIRTAMHAVVKFNATGEDSLCQAAGTACHATRWILTEHIVYSVLLFGGLLVIWSIFGAAICRIAAVQFASEEKIGFTEAVRFTLARWWSGFLVTPVLPIGIMLLIALLLALGGFLLWIPGLGNLFALLFPLALLGGLGLALLMVGCVGGGSFFWPTVAVEGSDGFDAISRSFSYFFSRPVKTILYGLTAMVCAGFCWVVLKMLLWLTLRAAHSCLSFGAGGFGTGWWGMRTGLVEGMTKVDAMWPAPLVGDLYHMGARDHLGSGEVLAAALIGVWVALAIGLLWAFLVSYYFSASTVVYYLLRRDVDATDCDDVYIDELDEDLDEPERAPDAPGGDVGLPVVQTPAAPAPPAESGPADSGEGSSDDNA